jgi:hypothetical protein
LVIKYLDLIQGRPVQKGSMGIYKGSSKGQDKLTYQTELGKQ